ncbi:hypothetical protein [Catellatospora sp. NPDC049609]|uniref:WD40 repeat domain-containing protein n=1 Tax=Catellatospora sp. NPDC049609 TaxID=3155505 RepID=UPI00341F3B5D
MTGLLRDALRQAAQEAPPPAATDGLWRRGRARRRWRRAGAAVAGVLAVLALAGAPQLLAGLQPAPQVSLGKPTSGSLGRAYPWLPTHERKPNGPAVAAFTGGGASLFGRGGVVVGRDGSYRLLPAGDDGRPGLLSPDGTLLARPGEIIDLRDGSVIGAGGGEAGRPVAWSPVGRRLLTVVLRLADGQPEDGALAPQYMVYDLDAGTMTLVMAAEIGAPAGAFSPDGQRVAVVYGPAGGQQNLVVLDLPFGRNEILRPLERHQRLAGSAAWTPDGRSVVLVAADGCGWPDCRERPGDLKSWHLQYVDTFSRLNEDSLIQVTDEQARRTGLPGELQGWHDGRPVLDVVGGGGPALVAAEPDGSARVLLAGPDGADDLSVPRLLAEQGAFASYAADPWQMQGWVYVALPVLPAAAAGAGWALWRRWRARRGQG